jgi:LPS sulfotransferase NodH
MRSGSTLLGEAIYFAGKMGCPLEYFHRGFRPPLAQEWQAEDIHSFIRAVYRFRTDPSGMLSVKLFWKDIEDIVCELDTEGFPELRNTPAVLTGEAVYSKIREMLAEIFPNPTFIHLERLDRVRQAVSMMVAAQTRLWRSIPGVGEHVPVEGPSYDYDRILNCMAYTDHCKTHWKNFFRVTGDARLEVTYEDLLRDYDATLKQIFDHVGCSGPLLPPRMLRQSNATSERIALRFLREYADKIASAAVTVTSR